jgi:hypothetical protein
MPKVAAIASLLVRWDLRASSTRPHVAAHRPLCGKSMQTSACKSDICFRARSHARCTESETDTHSHRFHSQTVGRQSVARGKSHNPVPAKPLRLAEFQSTQFRSEQQSTRFVKHRHERQRGVVGVAVASALLLSNQLETRHHTFMKTSVVNRREPFRCTRQIPAKDQIIHVLPVHMYGMLISSLSHANLRRNSSLAIMSKKLVKATMCPVQLATSH